MNTPLPPSDTPAEPDFNGFGSYRRKRPARDAGNAAPRRFSFRRIPRDGFPEEGSSVSAGDAPDAGDALPRRPPRKAGGRKPFGKKKPFGHGQARPPRPAFRDFADTIDEGEVPPPRRDRSFKNADARPRGEEGAFWHARKPFGGKKHGKKPFGKYRPFPKTRSAVDDGDGGYPGGPRAIRRPYGASSDDFPAEATSPPARKPFRKPFGKKPKPFPGKKTYGEKPFGKKAFHARKPFGTPSPDMAPDEAPAFFPEKPRGRKPFGKKPFGRGKTMGKKPFGRKPSGKGKPFGKKPFGPRRPPSRD